MNCSLASKSSQKSSFIFFYTIKLMCYRMMSRLCIVGVPTFAWLDSNSSGLTFSKATSNLRLAIKIVAQQLEGKVAFWPREKSTAIEVVAAAVAGGWGVARAKILHFGGIRPRLPFRKFAHFTASFSFVLPKQLYNIRTARKTVCDDY